MTLYVDSPQWPAHGRVFAHLISDESYAELHRFAARLQLHPRSFDGDHYDIPVERHADVLAAGAELVTGRELVTLLGRSGLRYRKRRGERPLARHHDVVPSVTGPHLLDVLASTREPPAATTAASAVFAFDHRDRILLVHHVARGSWEAPAGAREPGESPRETAVREAREETGVLLDASALRPVGYERITQQQASPRWPHLPHNHIAVYAVDLHESGVTATGRPHEVDQSEWVPVDEAARRAQGAFWWPLLDWVLEHR